jgi:hypothetical protein
MKTGTAVGLLVGGAVLILAAAPKKPVAGQVATPAPGGALNPFNWFGNAGAGQPSLASQIFGNSYNPNGGYSPATPYQIPASQTPNFGWGRAPTQAETNYNNQVMQQVGNGYTPGYNPASYTPPANAAGFYPVMTPMGGMQDYSAMSPSASPSMAAASVPYQSAANSTPYAAGSSPITQYG